ncbi:MAG TPA: helix-turn-helix transcriptional regulator [Hanamia sp.]
MKNNNIRHIREFKGYSQKYIAKRLGKSQPLISKIENGNTHLSDDEIEQLCKILEVAKEEIFDEETGGAKSLKNMITHLLDQFAENKKLLHDVEVNQKKLQQQLKLLLSKLLKETA